MAKRTLASVSVTELKAEINRRKKRIHTLVRKRNRLVQQLQQIDTEIEAEGGAEFVRMSPAGAGRKRGRPVGSDCGKRPRDDANLSDSMASVLSGKTMGVTELSEAVQKAGYRTTSPNFRTIVNQTLIKDKRFKRVERGLYTVK